jgi:hypothetical protein
MTSTAQPEGKTKNPLLAAALAYAAILKWFLFPLWPGTKVPIPRHGLKEATVDQDQIREWWRKHPRANIAVATGVQFFVLDRDPRHGGCETLQHLINLHGGLGDTVQQVTGGHPDGHHWFFGMPENFVPRSGELGEGLDVKGLGGYVLLPPSVHPVTRRTYCWDGLMPITQQKLLPAPEWLLAQIRAAHHKGPVMVPERIQYGQQHMTLFRLGASLRAKGCGEEEIRALLSVTNRVRCERPGPQQNIDKLAASICSQYAPGSVRRWKR